MCIFRSSISNCPFVSIIDGSKSNSKLKIENFKVINAPGMVKLLSLADLGGLADLAEGEGISFDILEINMEKINDILNVVIHECDKYFPAFYLFFFKKQDPKFALSASLIETNGRA